MYSFCGGGGSTLNALTDGVEELSSELTKNFLPPNYKFARAAVPGHGSCFFNSFLYLTQPESYWHLSKADKERAGRKCRAEFSALIDANWFKWIRAIDPNREYPEYHDSRLEVIKKWFKEPKIWANTIIIKFVAEYMNVDIMFIDSEAKALYCGIVPDKGESARKTIIIMWVKREHFEPVFMIYPPEEHDAEPSKSTRAKNSRGGKSVKLMIKTDFDPGNAEDSKIIRALRQNFRDTCSATLKV